MGKFKLFLTKRDRRLLDFVDRYRLATGGAFWPSVFSRAKSRGHCRTRGQETRAARIPA